MCNFILKCSPLFLLDSDFVHEALFTFSRRGHFKLVQDGYTFHKRDSVNRTDGSVVWRCDNYRTPDVKCRAIAVSKRFDTRERVKFCGEHLHPPDNVK